jgi:hypothetical protein
MLAQFASDAVATQKNNSKIEEKETVYYGVDLLWSAWQKPVSPFLFSFLLSTYLTFLFHDRV